MLWPRLRSLSGMCPCPPLVRLVLLSLAAPPVLVRHLFALIRHLYALCPPCVVGLQSLSTTFRLVSALCPPCVRLASAVAAPPNLVRHEPAMGPSCVRRISALAVPPNLVRHYVSALCPLRLPPKPRPLCVGQALSARLALYPPGVGFGRASKRCVSHVASVSAICPLLVFSLSSRCLLVFRSLSALCRFLAGSMVWLWPGLCQLCVRSLVFAPLSVLCPLLSTLVEVFVAGPLPAVRLVTFSRQCSCLT